jgi:hypothetical protein
MACDSRLLDHDSRMRAFQTIATNIEESLHVKHQTGSSKFRIWQLLVCTQSSGAAVTCLYISIKLLYTINVVLQILLLNTFLGNHSNWYGMEVLNDLMHNREWDESGNFPRVTLCDFEVKVRMNGRVLFMEHCFFGTHLWVSGRCAAHPAGVQCVFKAVITR